MRLLHRRTGKALAIGVIALWTATLACAATALTPAARHLHTPCCPRSHEPGCANSECARQAPGKAESGATRVHLERTALVAAAAALDLANSLSPQPTQELNAGLQFRAAVFRLKDDLRI